MSTAVTTPMATNSKAPRFSPADSLTAPKLSANGTKASHVSVPTPDATPRGRSRARRHATAGSPGC